MDIERRTYRNVDTAEEAHLSAGLVTRDNGQWWQVRLVRADGSPGTVAG